MTTHSPAGSTISTNFSFYKRKMQRFLRERGRVDEEMKRKWASMREEKAGLNIFCSVGGGLNIFCSVGGGGGGAMGLLDRGGPYRQSLPFPHVFWELQNKINGGWHWLSLNTFLRTPPTVCQSKMKFHIPACKYFFPSHKWKLWFHRYLAA